MLKLKLVPLFYLFLIIRNIKLEDNNLIHEKNGKHLHDYKYSFSESLTKEIYNEAKKFISIVKSIGKEITNVVQPKIKKLNTDKNDNDDDDDDDSIDTISEKASKKIIESAKNAVKFVKKTGKSVFEKTTHKSSREL
uniref:Exported protein n=1 Tax=Strongyloides stercoralis TaxID=6248 RepID=A0A0K0E9U6_STRER